MEFFTRSQALFWVADFRASNNMYLKKNNQ
jgi:hypothetical protein